MQIDGFFLKLSGSDLDLFWMASAFFFEINTQRFRLGGEPVNQPDTLMNPSAAGTPVPAELTAAEKLPDAETVSAAAENAKPYSEITPGAGTETKADTVSEFDSEPEYILPPDFNTNRNTAPDGAAADGAMTDAAARQDNSDAHAGKKPIKDTENQPHRPSLFSREGSGTLPTTVFFSTDIRITII